MADTDYLHTAEILRAAMPNVTNHIRPMLTMFASMMEMLGNMHIMKEPNLRAQSLDEQPMDVEALLTGIRQACNENEIGFVDQILNFLRMKKMMKTYQDMMQVMEMMQETNDNSSSSFNQTSHFTENETPEPDAYDEVRTSFAKDNSEVSSLDSTFFDADITKEPHDDTPEDHSFYQTKTGDGFVNQTLKAVSMESEQRNQPNTIFGNHSSGYLKKTNNNPFQTNPQMIHMLKSMLPAEQADMVDHISMLFHNQH